MESVKRFALESGKGAETFRISDFQFQIFQISDFKSAI